MNERARILDAAKAEIGNGRRADYWLSALGYDPGPKKAWCGAFCLWAMHEAGVGLDVTWGIDGTGLVSRAKLPSTRTPQRGDIVYIHKPFQHHALFDYEHDGWVWTVDGNQPGVSEKRRRKADITAFYSIQPLIDRAPKTDPAPPPAHQSGETLAVTLPTLRRSDEGSMVAGLQTKLNSHGANLTIDGEFGPLTEASVMIFQMNHSLKPDGVVGPKTWKALYV